jgi:hypothetical protein
LVNVAICMNFLPFQFFFFFSFLFHVCVTTTASSTQTFAVVFTSTLYCQSVLK